MYRNPIDQDLFLKVITANPGIAKPKLISRLRADKGKVKRAQTKAIRDGWLLVQLDGKIVRYYTKKYADDNGIKKAITAAAGAGSRNSPESIEFLEHCKFIDSCWIHQVASV